MIRTGDTGYLAPWSLMTGSWFWSLVCWVRRWWLWQTRPCWYYHHQYHCTGQWCTCRLRWSQTLLMMENTGHQVLWDHQCCRVRCWWGSILWWLTPQLLTSSRSNTDKLHQVHKSSAGQDLWSWMHHTQEHQWRRDCHTTNTGFSEAEHQQQ